MISDILSICKDRNISLTQLAKQCGISKGYLSLLISGKRSNMSHTILLRIAEELNISVKDLLSETPFSLNSAIDLEATELTLKRWNIPTQEQTETIHHLKRKEQLSLEKIAAFFAAYEQNYLDGIMKNPLTEEQVKILLAASLYNGELPESIARVLSGSRPILNPLMEYLPDFNIYRLNVSPKHILNLYSKQLPDILQMLRSALQDTMSISEAYLSLGKLCTRQNLNDYALEQYSYAALYARGEDKSSILEESIQIIRTFPATHMKNLILTWYESMRTLGKGLVTKTLADSAKVLELHNESSLEQCFISRIYSTRGAAYLLLGKYKDAFLNLKESICLWPNGPLSAMTYINIGTLMRRLGHLEMAKNYYHLALKDQECAVTPSALSSLAQIAIDEKDFVKAREYILKGYHFAKLFKTNLGKSELYVNLGLYYKEIGKYQRALYLFELAVKRTTRCMENRALCYALLEMADTYLRIKQNEKAIALIRELPSLMAGQGDSLLLAFWLNSKAKAYLSEQNASIALNFLLQTYGTLTKRSHDSLEYEECLKMLEQTYHTLQKPYKAQLVREERLKRQEKRVDLPVF